jgi:uncharacterized membrane protein YgcG
MRGWLVALFATIVFGTAGQVLAQSLPGTPTGYVNDYANVLNATTKSDLESELTTFEATTSNQIAVVIVQNMDGDYIEHYAADFTGDR